MAIPGEIEKLERRWHENPAGLVFTPLAEAYRRAGDPMRALTILQDGLRRHPEHIPALVVWGRCQLDLANFAEAEAAFARVLAGDPRHGIALRGLAEVYERTGRITEAIARLEVLVETDQHDSAARHDLRRLRALGEPAALAELESGTEVPAMSLPDPPVESVPPFEEDAPLPAELEAAPASPELVAVPGPEVESDAVQAPEPELVVTESMAELFLRQGHRELALAVYRQLVARSPEPRLHAVIQELESARPAPAAPAASGSGSARAPAEARTTGGRSVEEYLRSVLETPPPDPSPATRLAPGAPPAVRGEPARPAGELLSLGAVFGDDPPAPPSGAALPAEAPASGENALSYDEFFGAPPPVEPGPRAGQADDLAQFTEWLRGLTR